MKMAALRRDSDTRGQKSKPQIDVLRRREKDVDNAVTRDVFGNTGQRGMSFAS